MSNIRLLMVDDHKIIRDGMKFLLDEYEHIEVVGEASNGREALTFLESKADQVDIVLMDINMPEMDGIECVGTIREKNIPVKILILTMLNEEQHIREMLALDVDGYIMKKSGEEELINAINTIMQGKHYFSEEATEVVLRQFVAKPKGDSKPIIELTEREKEILAHIVDENTNIEIAEKLFISVRTVDAHRRNVMEKIGAKNTAGLVKYALQNGIVNK